jgi:hypothetical protein
MAFALELAMKKDLDAFRVLSETIDQTLVTTASDLQGDIKRTRRKARQKPPQGKLL